MDSTATLRIRTTRELTCLSLDALGLDTHSVSVCGRPAGWEQADEKLWITPARPLPAAAAATVCVSYSADPRRTLPHTAWVPIPDGRRGGRPPRELRDALTGGAGVGGPGHARPLALGPATRRTPRPCPPRSAAAESPPLPAAGTPCGRAPGC